MTQEPQGSRRLQIEFAQASDPGRDPNKQVNEDSCGYADTRFGHLCVLCDGMGGHYGGKEASRTAITTIFEVFEQYAASQTPAQALKASIEEAGRRVYRLGGPPENRTRPGSTVVALLLHEKGLDVAHVGDSRAYIIRSNQIYPLTRDHSMVQGMIDAGMLTEESAMGHPDSNKITRALGMKPEVEVELRPDTMELFAGDVLMQSSDGLTDLALGRDILGATRQALASGGVEHACNMLVKMANDRGGHDNITVQMVRVTEVAPKTSTTIPERPAGQAQPQAAPSALSPQAAQPHAPPGPTPPMTPTPGPVSAGPNHGSYTGQQVPQAPGSFPGAGPPSMGRPAGSVPLETMAMSSPMAAMANPSYVGNQHVSQVLGGAAAPPAPTPTGDPAFPPPSIGFGPAPGAAAPSPTLSGGPADPAPASQGWGPPSNAADRAFGSGVAASQGLAPYRADGPNALPLPPSSLRPAHLQQQQQQAPYQPSGVPPTGPMHLPPPPTAPMAAPQQVAAFGAPAPTPGAIPGPAGLAAPAPARGLAWLIFGLAAVIAILVVVILVLALR